MVYYHYSYMSGNLPLIQLELLYKVQEMVNNY